ncbi:hypothetical protein DYB32_008626 [Aphanomyces invadans]|uniref:Carbonic anhydrase n=1 Tax=Aphanomyces invadans TaxID=157072 RepID=A0A3R7A6G0_9STRA|nr:hypothetical protein DYB32_008626 [Aphanomyces invadans]
MKFLPVLVTALFALATGTTTPEFAPKAQTRQSPINLPYLPVVPNNGAFSIQLDTAPAVVSHENHTVKATWNAGVGSFLNLNGKEYNSVQFHPHAPSEHTIRGVRYPFEVHFVHQDKNKNLAVVGILFELDPNDEPNPFLDQYFSGFSQLASPGDSFTLDSLDPSSLDVTNSNVYRYPGSLTTEPYTEGVEWSVLQEVHTMSLSQLEAWESVIHHPNARPLQPLNGRSVKLVAANV